MSYIVEFDDKAESYRMVVIRLTNGESTGSRYGKHRCGYVSVPSNHPLSGKGYDHKIKVDLKSVSINETDPVGTLLSIFECNSECETEEGRLSIGYLANVHGGITYSDGESGSDYPVKSDEWWFGFDAAHFQDDDDGGRSLDYMKSECEKLKSFLQKNEV